MTGSWSRRKFLGASALTLAPLAGLPGAARGDRILELRATESRVQMVPEEYGPTGVWSFNGSVPGPEVRRVQGDSFRARFVNQLSEPSTIHWHGIRVPHAMDGVPHLTQAPVEPGQSFDYAFDLPDAGTYWYHPHQRSLEQVGRGLYGAFIVEEREPIQVDREWVWVLDDWRLQSDAQISPDFEHRHDLSHGGRIGNTVTISGRLPDAHAVRTGERIRLRLVNAANARIFGLNFTDHDPEIIAIDGHPVTPHRPAGNRVELAPGMRTDLVLDMTGNPGQVSTVVDDYYPRQPYALVDLAYRSDVLRKDSLDSGIRLPPNPLPQPDLAGARRISIGIAGGAMGGMDGALLDGQWRDIRTLARQGQFWAINGVSSRGHMLDPMLTFARGESVILDMENRTAWPHPMHLHGHVMQVIARDGREIDPRPWQDTVLIPPRASVTVALVADNPGDWMFHCHVLEHQASGMMAVVRVT